MKKSKIKIVFLKWSSLDGATISSKINFSQNDEEFNASAIVATTTVDVDDDDDNDDGVDSESIAFINGQRIDLVNSNP